MLSSWNKDIIIIIVINFVVWESSTLKYTHRHEQTILGVLFIRLGFGL